MEAKDQSGSDEAEHPPAEAAGRIVGGGVALDEGLFVDGSLGASPGRRGDR